MEPTPEQIQEWKQKAEAFDSKNNSLLRASMEVVCNELAKDKSEGSYYYSWQANIAMAFQDEFKRYAEDREIQGTATNFNIHQISNNAAKNFLDMLIKL